MQAFVIDKPGSCSLTNELAKPEVKSGEVLVKIKKVGFCGSDLNTFRGLNPIVSYPRIPGHEIAAEIVELGEGVKGDYKAGDKVLILPYTTCGTCWSCLTGRPNACKNNKTLGVQQDGGMSEYLSVPAEKLVTGINDMSFSEIAIVEPLAVGFHAARRAESKDGEYMLVFGCGMVGLGAIAKGARDGATVIAVDIDDEKLELSKAFGAEHVINSAKLNLEEEVLRLTEGHGASVTVEAIGLAQTFVAAVDLTAFAGRVVYVGYVKDAVSFDTKKFVMKEIQIRGARNAIKDDFVDVLKAMKDMNLPIGNLISKDVPLADAPEALEYWSEHTAEITKILVSFD